MAKPLSSIRMWVQWVIPSWSETKKYIIHSDLQRVCNVPAVHMNLPCVSQGLGQALEKLVDLERLSCSPEVTQNDMESGTKRGTKVLYPLLS